MFSPHFSSHSRIDPNIQDYLNNLIISTAASATGQQHGYNFNNIYANNEEFYAKDYFSPSPKSMSFQSSSLDDPMSDIVNINDDMFTTSVDYNPVNNANLLRDIESLIQSMERKQTHSQHQHDVNVDDSTEADNENSMLRNIDSILSNIKLNESRPNSPQSNISAEPIRMKSPIMMAKIDKNKVNGTHYISEDVQNFISNNIQEILPDLVGQVKQELKEDVDFNDDIDDEFYDATEQEDYFRNRHNEEFEEQLHSSSTLKTVSTETAKDDKDSLESHFNDFFLSRHDEEFNERYSPTSRFNNHHQTENERHEHKIQNNDYVVDDDHDKDDDNIVNHDLIDFIRQRHDEEFFETNENIIEERALDQQQKIDDNPSVQRYKSSYNLKILKKHSKRTNKKERDFKRRNSLILGSALLGIISPGLGKQSYSKSSESLNNSKTSLQSDFLPSPSSYSSDDAANINHETLMTSVDEIQNEINTVSVIEIRRDDGSSGSKEGVHENNIIDEKAFSTQQQQQQQLTSSHDNNSNSNGNEVIERTIETVVEIIINDEMGVHAPSVASAIAQHHQQNYIINDDAATLGELSSDIFDDSMSNVTTPIPQSSSSVSINDSESIKIPQNLSELVEDTQRLIKQMKDEINAIYVSDEDKEEDVEDLSEYTDDENWIDSYGSEEDEVEEIVGEDESEYDDWSGDFIEETTTMTTEQVIIEKPLFSNKIIIGDEMERIEVITGTIPNAVVNEATQQPATAEKAQSDDENVVHGKLELALTLNVDASNIENVDGNASEILNANESNLTKEDDVDGDGEEVNNEISETQLPTSSSNEATAAAINNEIKMGENSIKAIVTEAINEYISAISFDETENIVSQGNDDDNHSQIALSALPTSSSDTSTSPLPSPSFLASTSKISVIDNIDDDKANIDSVINNSVTEVMPKLSDNNRSINNNNNNIDVGNDESIKLSNNTELNLVTMEEIIYSGTSESVSYVPETMSNLNEKLPNNDEKSVVSVKNDSSEDMQMALEETAAASALTTQHLHQEQQKEENDESQESLIINVDGGTNEKVIATPSDLQPTSSARGISPSKTGTKSKIPKKEKSKENNQQLTAKTKTSSSNDARKKSIGSSPFTVTLGTSNVKSLQSQFLKASTSSSSSSLKPQITKLKPSKLVPPKILTSTSSTHTTSSTTNTPTFANKLTKLITPSINDVKGANNDEKRIEEPIKDHSKAIVPKKNYMEHCFSDEYSTTSEDDEDDTKISPTKRNLFTLSNKEQKIASDDDETSDVRYHLIFIEFSSFYCIKKKERDENPFHIFFSSLFLSFLFRFI